MFGAGTGVDVAVIVIIIIIIILILFLFLFKKRKSISAHEVEPMNNKKEVSSGLDRVHGPKHIMSMTKDEPGIASAAILSSHTSPTSAPKPKITPRHSQTQPYPHIPTKAPMPKVTLKPVTNMGTTEPPTTKSLIRKIPMRKPIVQSEITREKLKVDLGPIMETYNNKQTTPKKPKPTSKPKPKIVSSFDFGEQTPAEYRYDTIMEFMENLHIHHYKAETLYDGGFTSWAQLSEATTKDLIKVKGIGPKLADKIQRNVKTYQRKQGK